MLEKQLALISGALLFFVLKNSPFAPRGGGGEEVRKGKKGRRARILMGKDRKKGDRENSLASLKRGGK